MLSMRLLLSGGREPMCMDEPWEKWADAWINKKPFKADRAGVAYMLAGDTGASNTDPFATAATASNQWVVEGPHIMLLVPDAAQLEGVPYRRNAFLDRQQGLQHRLRFVRRTVPTN